MTAFICAGIALGMGALSLIPFTHAGSKPAPPPGIVASQGRDAPHFREMDEISGIALAGFRDESGSPLLWGQEERTSRLVLLRTRPAASLYAGAITMPGRKTRDAEDIAIVHGNGRSTLYLEDAGSNRKDMPVCVRYARRRDNPERCSVADTVALSADTRKKRIRKTFKEECLARGDDWIFLNETDHLPPGAHPEIRRMPEPSYQDALRGKAVPGVATIEFDYPQRCGDRRCREFPGNKMADIAGSYNTESLAVVEEPDHSHTAYLFSKAHRSFEHLLKKQHPHAAACKFDTDGLSDAFRLRNIDSLTPGKVHEAEYVTTLDLADTGDRPDVDDSPDRVTAANFLRLSASQGLLLLRTTGRAYKWPVALAHEQLPGSGVRDVFDVAGALTHASPAMAAIPSANAPEGIGLRNQEAAAQLDENAIYYMGECKTLPKCAIALVRDDHPFLPGDVDGNGQVDRADIDRLRQFLAGQITLYCLDAADVNSDGRVSQDDLDYLVRYVARKGPAPIANRGGAANPKPLGCGYYPPGSGAGRVP